MPKPSVAIRLGTDGKAQVKADFDEVGRSGDAAAKRLGDSFERESQRADRARQKMAETAARIATMSAQTPVQMRINDAVGTNFSDYEGSARRSAQAFLEAESAAEAMEARTRALMAAIDPAWAAQQRFNAEVLEAKTLMDAGRISVEQYTVAEQRAKAALDQATVAHDRNHVSAGAQRAGMQQLTMQIGDMATMYALGARPMQIFASQSAQVVGAVQLMTGGTSKLAAFLGGPWGMALTAGALVLLPLIGNLTEAESVMKSVEMASDSMGSAQSTLGQIFDLTTGKVKSQNEALRLNAQLLAINMRAEAIAAEARAKATQDESGEFPGIFGLNGAGPVRRRGAGRVRGQQSVIQSLLGQVQDGKLDGGSALDRIEKLDFSSSTITREQAITAVRNIVTARGNREAEALIRKALDENVLPSELRQNGRSPHEPRARTGGGKSDVERLAEEQAGIRSGFQDRFDPIAAIERKRDEDLARLDKIRGIITGEEAGKYEQAIQSETLKSLFKAENPGKPTWDEIEKRVTEYRDRQAQGLELAEAELGLIGKSRDERDRELSTLQLKQDLLRDGIDLTGEEGEAIVANHIRLLAMSAAIRAANDNWDEATQIGEQFIDTVLDPSNWKDWGDLGKQVINDLMNDFIRLAAINPLKNALFGGDLPVLGGVLGAFGNVGKSSAGADINTIFSKGGLGFAAGTEYFGGGMATVGEFGPENVFLPRGSRVMTAPETRRMNSGGGAPVMISTTINAEGADAAALARVEAKVDQMNQSMATRIVSTVNDAKQRGFIG